MLFTLVSVVASAAILPQRLGDFYQTKTQAFTPTEAAVYKEYGFDAAEKSQYAAGDRKLEISALRAKDPTGAFGMYEWLRPPEAKSVDMGERGVEAGDATYFQYGNYVIILRGAKPDPEPLEAMLSILPRFEHSAPPPLVKRMPLEGLIPNSERYILGPVVLAKLAPSIPPSVVAFHYGTEAQMAEYAAGGGRLKMALFSYPTPQLARAQAEEFQKLPSLVVKRSGVLIAAVVDPFSRDEAEKLLAHVRYEATLTWSQQPLSKRDNIGDLILNIMLLCAILAGLCVIAGLGVGGFRILLSKILPGRDWESQIDRDFVRLHLNDK
ncbi:MAG: hypothetical protein HY238_16465 [Acidobacteria bacterium]|nr:hypothetical protein [Acidobacteriota bacterium]